jgi:aminoglycoside phosphotransferase family enzyme/predicted kinase
LGKKAQGRPSESIHRERHRWPALGLDSAARIANNTDMATDANPPSLIRALQRSTAFPHPVGELRLLETHISWVVLTGEFAYKIKKPVRFNFVDYSTLKLRRACCEEELRLNRRLAPELYLDVAPITGPPEAATVNGDGEPIEYAVRMRQFDQNALLAEAMLEGKTTARHFREFGRHLAEFHDSLRDVPTPSGLGTLAQISTNVGDVFELLTEHAPAAHSAIVAELDAWRRGQEQALSETFRDRLANGFVRECHGDLHLGNLLLWNDRITAFDGIEFNPSLRWIDVLSEAAFLFMDLEAERRRDVAYEFLNAYLEVTGDYAGMILLPYYIVYRAAVRAAVTLLRCGQLSDEAEIAALRGTAERYLGEAKRWRERPTPWLWIMHGVSGSGKTAIASQLAGEHGAIRIRSDVERKRMLGVRVDASAPVEAYSEAASQATYRRLESLAESLLAAGFAVIVDATFLRRAERQRFRDLSERMSVPFKIWACHAPRDELVRRILARRNDASDATVEVLDNQLRTLEPLDEIENAQSVASGSTGPSSSPATRS